MGTTWNPLDKGTSVTLSDDKLTATSPNYSNSVRGTTSKSSGVPYFECTSNGGAMNIGVANSGINVNGAQQYFSSDQAGYYSGGNNTPSFATYGASYTSGDVVGVGVDFTESTLTFWKNRVLQGKIYGIPTGSLFPYFSPASYNKASATINLSPYPVPAGYTAWDANNYHQAMTGGM